MLVIEPDEVADDPKTWQLKVWNNPNARIFKWCGYLEGEYTYVNWEDFHHIYATTEEKLVAKLMRRKARRVKSHTKWRRVA